MVRQSKKQVKGRLDAALKKLKRYEEMEMELPEGEELERRRAINKEVREEVESLTKKLGGKECQQNL